MFLSKNCGRCPIVCLLTTYSAYPSPTPNMELLFTRATICMRYRLNHGTVRKVNVHSRRPLVSVALDDGSLFIIHSKVSE